MKSHPESRTHDRRLFLKAGASIAAAAAWSERGRAQDAADPSASPHEKVVVGIMGVNGRGGALAKSFMAADNVEIGTICDVDSRAAERVTKTVTDAQGKAPRMVKDFREILDDKDIDTLVIAAPNHWHAPAAIAACNAGKHVYVEKPCCHNAQEGEWAIEAARKQDRVVQVGTQRRSWPALVEGVAKVHQGVIGKTLYARSWYNNRRGPIGVGQPAAVPDWLDWRLWQGPAPDRPFKDNLVHYNWHWHWHWGNGELGNNGIHGLDVARWALDVTFPNRVSAGGGRHRYEDDQETPDTMVVTFDFPEGKTITWEGLSWSPLGVHDSRFGVSIHGTEGSMVIRGGGYAIYDLMDNELESQSGRAGDPDHLADFLDAIRTGRRPNADIEISHQSTALCHLGNIAYRTASTLRTDPRNGHIIDNPRAESLWGRDYAPGWEPKV